MLLSPNHGAAGRKSWSSGRPLLRPLESGGGDIGGEKEEERVGKAYFSSGSSSDPVAALTDLGLALGERAVAADLPAVVAALRARRSSRKKERDDEDCGGGENDNGGEAATTFSPRRCCPSHSLPDLGGETAASEEEADEKDSDSEEEEEEEEDSPAAFPATTPRAARAAAEKAAAAAAAAAEATVVSEACLRTRLAPYLCSMRTRRKGKGDFKGWRLVKELAWLSHDGDEEEGRRRRSR